VVEVGCLEVDVQMEAEVRREEAEGQRVEVEDLLVVVAEHELEMMAGSEAEVVDWLEVSVS